MLLAGWQDVNRTLGPDIEGNIEENRWLVDEDMTTAPRVEGCHDREVE